MNCRPYRACPGNPKSVYGFTLVELMIVVAIVAILAGIGYPQYVQYTIRSSREAAQTELVQLAALQEKIYLNSNAYAASITSTYNGTSGGGLGKTTGLTVDGKYTLSISPNTPGQNFTITATPVTGKSNAADGDMTIDSTGQRLRNGANW
jgi:type IV pilus assembly protein PilE